MFRIFPFCIVIGYGLGCINPAYFLGKKKGVDIKKTGSGNAGGSNALIALGKVAGFFCILFDIGKAYLALTICSLLFGNTPFVFAITSIACILGHIFPFYIHFNGGKGLACLAGCVLWFSPSIFLLFLLLEAAIAIGTSYICFVPLTASVLFPPVFYMMTNDLFCTLLLFIPTIIMYVKHQENLQKIKQGTEIRIRYLWDKENESERVANALGISPDASSDEYYERNQEK